MSVLICGSIAFDTIMMFHDRFKNHILADQVHILNVSFLVPEMRREYGGCAGNIAYNLKMLGGEPLPMATVGRDYEPYFDWLEHWEIDTGRIQIHDNTYTAQAFITTDQDANQITAFHPGAMSFAHENRIEDTAGIQLGIIAPDGRDGMIEHATQLAEAGIPFLFDPGQGLPMFDGHDLKHFIEQARWVAVNDYEAQLLADRTGLSFHDIAERIEALIITKGAEGSHIYTRQHRLEIPVAPVRQLRDPTGCGDAFRAGLAYGLGQGMDWETTGRIASLMGAIKIERHGTQNHRFTVDEFKERFQEAFGYSY